MRARCAKLPMMIPRPQIARSEERPANDDRPAGGKVRRASDLPNLFDPEFRRHSQRYTLRFAMSLAHSRSLCMLAGIVIIALLDH